MRWLIVIILSVTIACAAGTRPFDPNKQIDVEREIAKQRGIEIYDGMPCDEYCEITQSCNIRQRINARMNPGYACKTHSAEAFRQAIKRGRH